MSTILSKSDILKLYRAKSYEDLVVFGRAIKHTVPVAKLRKLTIDDIGSKAHDAEYNRLMKTPSKPAAQVIESQVNEIF